MKGASLTERLKRSLDEERKAGKSYGEALINRLILLAIDGDLSAIKYIMDRLEGSPVARTLLGSDEHEPIRIVLRYGHNPDEEARDGIQPDNGK